MSFRWSEPDSLKLIELYKSYDFLWNKDSELYRNINARKQAYDEITKEINIPHLTAQDVRCKIKNLRSAYHLELRKNEHKHAPLPWWFRAMKGIMMTIQEKKIPIEVSDDESTNSSNDNPDPEVTEEELPFVEECTENADAYVVSIKREYLDEMAKDALAVADYLEPVAKKPKVLNEQNNEQLKPVKVEKIANQSVKHKGIDEFQLFANNIAAQLRRMPLDKALHLEVEMQSIIAKERIKILRREKQRNE